MPVLQHRSPLQGKYKEVQPLLPLLRAGFAVVKEEEIQDMKSEKIFKEGFSSFLEPAE